MRDRVRDRYDCLSYGAKCHVCRRSCSATKQYSRGQACALLLFIAGLYAGLKDYFYVPLCFAGLIYWASLNRGSLLRMLECAPLLSLGEVSYSTYLCHFFVKDWVLFGLVRGPQASAFATTAYLLLTLAASYLLYRFVEVPGQRFVKDAWFRYRAPQGEGARS